jgi:hypothetical protein
MEANQTVRLELGTKSEVKSMRIGFTAARLLVHGGLAVSAPFIRERVLRGQLRAVLARVPHRARDPSVAEVLGIEAVAN